MARRGRSTLYRGKRRLTIRESVHLFHVAVVVTEGHGRKDRPLATTSKIYGSERDGLLSESMPPRSIVGMRKMIWLP